MATVAGTKVSFSLILSTLNALFKFPTEFKKLLQFLEKAPEEKRQEMIGGVDKWLQESAASERPIFDRGQQGSVKIIFAFVLGLTIFTACAAAPIVFPFKWWHVQPSAVWQAPSGKLLSEKPEDDKPLSFCMPTKNSEGKDVQQCVVMSYAELNALIKDYKDTKQKLIDCQRGASR